MVQSQRFDTIQILRGFAATIVVLVHILHGIESEGYKWTIGDFIFSNGEIGVDIFFVISGFIIYYTAFSRTPPTTQEFLINRFWRLFPPYWAVTLLLLFMGIALYLLMGDQRKLYSLETFLKSLLLVPMLPSNYILTVAWTLSLEVVFYLMFSFFALRFGVAAFFSSMAIWYALSIAGLFYSNDFSGWGIPILNPVILEFLFGSLIAKFLISGKARFHGAIFLVGCIFVTFALLGGLEPSPLFRREFLFGVPAALLVYGAVGMAWRWPTMLLTWGESSYLLYLIHIPCFLLIGRGIEELVGYNIYSSPFASMTMVAFVVAIAYNLTILVERPYQRFYKSHLRRRPPIIV